MVLKSLREQLLKKNVYGKLYHAVQLHSSNH